MGERTTTVQLAGAVDSSRGRVDGKGLSSGQQELLLRGYVGVVFLFATALFFLNLFIEFTNQENLALKHLGFFIALSILADRYKIRVSNESEISAGFLADFLAGALLGPLAGSIVAASAIIGFYRKGSLSRNLFHVGAFSICGGATALVYQFASGTGQQSIYTVALAGLLAGSAYQLINAFLFIPIVWLRHRQGAFVYFREMVLPFLSYHYFFLAVSLGLIYSFMESETVFLVTLLPIVGLIYAFKALTKEKDLTKSLERFSLQIAGSMITALDLKDNYTARHSAAVAQYSEDIATELNLARRESALAHISGLLHDLGKISVPDAVLNSKKHLHADDWLVIRKHPEAGREIVNNITELADLGHIILHHHERFDGSGYPSGFAGQDIPIISRIVAVADAYSAMVSDRPYRVRLNVDDAIAELAEQSGKQFDPEIVAAFLNLLERGNLGYRQSIDADFHVEFQKVRLLKQLS